MYEYSILEGGHSCSETKATVFYDLVVESINRGMPVPLDTPGSQGIDRHAELIIGYGERDGEKYIVYIDGHAANKEKNWPFFELDANGTCKNNFVAGYFTDCVNIDDWVYDKFDQDNDGIPDGCDICPDKADHYPGNADGDVMMDEFDNCPCVYNHQADCDHDGFGDACDRNISTCVNFNNSWGFEDCDGNGTINMCDDNCSCTDEFLDCDGDGIIDRCDKENCACAEEWNDCDGDGIMDECEGGWVDGHLIDDMDVCLDFADEIVDLVPKGNVQTGGLVRTVAGETPDLIGILYEQKHTAKCPSGNAGCEDAHNAELRWCECEGDAECEQRCLEPGVYQELVTLSKFDHDHHDSWHLISHSDTNLSSSELIPTTPVNDSGLNCNYTVGERVCKRADGNRGTWVEDYLEGSPTASLGNCTAHCNPQTFTRPTLQEPKPAFWDWSWELWWSGRNDTSHYSLSEPGFVPRERNNKGGRIWLRPEIEISEDDFNHKTDKYREFSLEDGAFAGGSGALARVPEIYDWFWPHSNISINTMHNPAVLKRIDKKNSNIEMDLTVRSQVRHIRVIISGINSSEIYTSGNYGSADNTPDNAATGGIVTMFYDGSRLTPAGAAYSTGTADSLVATRYFAGTEYKYAMYVDEGEERYDTGFAVFGGELADGNLSNKTYFARYNGRDADGVPIMVWDSVSITGTKPEPRKNASIIYDEELHRLIMLGGETNGYSLSDVWALDLTTYTWSELYVRNMPSLAGARVMVFDNQAYVMGGYYGSHNNFVPGNKIYKFSIKNLSIHNIGYMDNGPGLRVNSSMAAGVGNTSETKAGVIYAFGGVDSNGTVRNDLWKFTVATNFWEIVQNDCSGATCPIVTGQIGNTVLVTRSNGGKVAVYANDGRVYETNDGADGWKLVADYSGKTCDGNYTIYDSEDIADLKGCSKITGNLNVTFAGLTDLKGLENLSQIGGNLNINFNDNLTSLAGLDNLAKVEGNFYFEFNGENLTSMRGLGNLREVSGKMIVEFNDGLQNFYGLSRLAKIGDKFYVGFNDFSLESLRGMSSLSEVGGDFAIEFNDGLVNFDGIYNLQSIGGRLYIGFNSYWFTSVDGLEGLRTVENNVKIEFNNGLSSLKALTHLTSIGSKLYVGFNNILPNCEAYAVEENLRANGWNGTVRIIFNDENGTCE